MTNDAGSAEDLEVRREQRLDLWQRRLLPFLMWMLGVLTAVFLLATLYHLQTLQDRIEAGPADIPTAFSLAPALQAFDGPATPRERLASAQWKTLALLEQHAMARRYHQANMLLMTRTWTSYLGFLTGMILTMVGATFILGKLREEVSAMKLHTPVAEANLRTTSPGLALCSLGTLLILSTILTHNRIDITESRPLYLNVVPAFDSTGTADPEPPPEDPSADPIEGPEASTPSR